MININKRGFTIIELMIALSVLSTILIMSSTIVINLGNIFTKGINQSNTQNTARNIMNEISSQLQLGGATPVIPGGNVFCLGSQRYNYRPNVKLDGNSASDHVLWRDTLNNSGASTTTCQAMAITGIANPTDANSDLTVKGTELLSPNMRITDLIITDNTNGSYTVTVTVAYGGDQTDPPNDLVQRIGGNTRCVGSGSQFCAVSSLTQVVSKRGIN